MCNVAVLVGEQMQFRALFTGLGLLLASPGIANAADVLLAPIAGRGVKAGTLANITSLISSELDFSPGVSSIKELSSTPSTLTSSCLKSTSCLRGIGKQGQGEQLVAGYVTTGSGGFNINLVLFDMRGESILRNHSATLGASPEALADGMTSVIKGLMTGKTKTQAAAEENFDFGDFDDEDDFEFEDPAVAEAENRQYEEEQEQRKAQQLARQRAEEAARRKAEEAARRKAEEEARRRAEEAARRKAEEEARRRVEANARRKAEEERQARETDDDEFDPNAFSFGTGGVVEEDDDSSRSSSFDEDLDDEFADEEAELAALDGDDLLDLDEDLDEKPRRTKEKAKPTTRERESNKNTSTVKTSRSSSDAPVRFELTARAGYSPYYNLGFITYGGEAGIAIGQTGLFVLAGVEAYSVQRDIPEQFQDGSGITTEWNTIFPINTGITYRFLNQNIRPYVGADVIFAQYYVGAQGSSWTVGARGRAGLNLMVAKNFGFNLNAAVGFWQGKNWGIIQQEVKKSGFLPQVSAGTVFAF